MQSLTNTGYPRNLSYCVKRLSGYSRNNVKLNTLNQVTAVAGNIITVDLPTNCMIDLSTFTMYFNGTTTTTTGFANFPRNIETLIERLEVEINGQIINGGCQAYNQLFQAISDTSFGNDVRNRRSVLQSGADAVVPAGNVANWPYAIQTWLGFISSVSPNILDTSLLGNVRLRITLTNTGALVTNGPTAITPATGVAYSLTNIFFSTDIIDIQDGMYHQIHDQALAKGMVYEMPFNNYFSFNSVGGLSQTTKFSLSTQSLNRVWAMFIPGAAYRIDNTTCLGVTTTGTAGAAADPIAHTSSYFTRVNGGAGGTVITYGDATNNTPITYTYTQGQFSVNNVFFPNWQVPAEFQYALMLNSYGLSQDTLGGGYYLLNSMGNWLSSLWLAEQRFDHGGGDGISLISGIDTRGSTAQMYFQSAGTIAVGANVGTGANASPGTSLVCQVFAQCTSSLRVGAGRQIEVVL